MERTKKESPAHCVEKVVFRPTVACAVLLAAFQLCGCAAVGPATVNRDRFDYVEAISTSWKRQTLFNLIKIRYLDVPVLIDVSSVISQYALETQIELGFSWDMRNTQRLGGEGKYTDRPTITYNPVVGRNYARSLLAPLPLPAILLLVQSGYPVHHVFRICVQDINGLNNSRSGVAVERKGDPAFFELLDLLHVLQETDGIAMRPRVINEREKIVMIFKTPKDEATSGLLKKVKEHLGLNMETMEFPVVHGGNAVNDQEIAIQGRSMLQIMTEYAAGIDVPSLDVSEGRVYAVETRYSEQGQLPTLIKVRNGARKPGDAFVAVPYRDHWFWIEDQDIRSKTMFRFLMILFSFTERGESGQVAPVVTVPTN
jgi:hypothetical protein